MKQLTWADQIFNLVIAMKLSRRKYASQQRRGYPDISQRLEQYPTVAPVGLALQVRQRIGWFTSGQYPGPAYRAAACIHLL